MVKTKFKKAVSLVLATVMSLTAFMGIGATTAFAAVGEKADVYLVDYPRSGDTNNNGEWGHGNLNYMNGWKGLSTKYAGLRAMGSFRAILPTVLNRVQVSGLEILSPKRTRTSLITSARTERFPAMTFACLSVVSCSTATVEVFRQAGSRRMKATQTASHTLMPLRF